MFVCPLHPSACLCSLCYREEAAHSLTTFITSTEKQEEKPREKDVLVEGGKEDREREQEEEGV